jgi:hypothetical protein
VPGALLMGPDHGAADQLDRRIPGAACSNRRHDFI